MMVDLVKIRKKAREKKAGRNQSEEGAASGEEQAPKKQGTKSRSGSGKTKKKSSKKSGKKEKSSRKRSQETSPKGGKKKATKSSEPKPKTSDAADLPSEEPVVETPATETAEEAKPQQAEQGPEEESKLSRFKRTAGVVDETEEGESVDEDQETVEEQLELITFTLAGEQYAMEVDRLVEIIVPRRSTHVPNADDAVIGIISLRGSVVTLLDLRRILGHPGEDEETEDTRIVVIQSENEQIGFIVDRVLRVVKVAPDSIEPHPVVSAAEQNEAVKGVFLLGDTITIYLDLDRIIGSI